MDACDKALAEDGVPLVNKRPFKIVTAWRDTTDFKSYRYHDVPSKLNNWPKVAVIERVVSQRPNERPHTYWEYALTQQAMIDVEPDVMPITGTEDTLEAAQNVVDKWLMDNGWLVP